MAHPARRTSVWVLVVEDDRTVASLLGAVIDHVPGWGAVVVGDAETAWETLRRARVDAMVLDVNLPGMSGIELLDRLAEDGEWEGREWPAVVLMSAAATQATVVAAMERHAGHADVRFVRKPFDIDEILAEIGDAEASARRRLGRAA